MIKITIEKDGQIDEVIETEQYILLTDSERNTSAISSASLGFVVDHAAKAYNKLVCEYVAESLRTVKENSDSRDGQ